MAQINSHLLPGMETIFLMTRPEHSCFHPLPSGKPPRSVRISAILSRRALPRM